MYTEAKKGRLGSSEVEKLSSITRPCRAGPNSVRPEGLYYVAVEPNGFGIPSVGTCPGKTDYCESDCYAIDSEKRTATHEKLQRNLDILLEAQTVEGMTERLRELVHDYRMRADVLGVPENKRRYRIHWSGDFFSEEYALAWRNVILENPDIVFWTYTRSFQADINVLPVLSGISNLDFFISVDYQNVDRAADVLPGYPDVKVAYLVDYEEEAGDLIKTLGREDRRHLACPENMRDETTGKRRLPVIGKRGGACAVCTYCIDKPDTWDVVFVKTGRQKRLQGVLLFPEPVEIGRREPKVAVAQKAGALSVGYVVPDLFGNEEFV